MEEILDIDIVNIVRFAVIDANGDILWIGECPEDEVSMQASETGQTVRTDVPANVTDQSHYYKNGAYKAYPAKPGSWSVFNYTTETWTDTRSADRNLDFDRQDYSIEPSITVSGTILSYTAFTATRDNGVYAESKTKSAGSVAFSGSPILIAYSWDENTIAAYASYTAMNSSPRRFLLGEFRSSGFFIPADNLVNGEAVASNSVDTPQLAPSAVTGTELALGAVGMDHIEAGAIVTRHLRVTAFDNLLGGYDTKETSPLIPDGWAGEWSTDVGYGGKSSIVVRDTSTTNGGFAYRMRPIPVNPGDEYYLSFYVARNSNWNGTTANSKLRIGDQNGYNVAQVTYDSASIPHFTSNYVKKEINYKVPVGVTQLNLSLVSDATAGFAYLSSLEFRLKSGGELIVDGAVKAEKIDVDDLSALGITVGSADIRNSAVGTLKIAGNAVTVPVSQSLNNSVNGNNAWQVVNQVNFTMPFPGQGTVIWTGSPAYAASQNQALGVRIRLNGVIVDERLTDSGNSGAYNQFMAYGTAVDLSARTHTVTVEWFGQNSNVRMQSRTLTVLGTMR